LEWARIEEFLNELKEARKILKQARKDHQSEWKVFLESALLEMRAGNMTDALQLTKEALEVASPLQSALDQLQ
jgi:putative NADH-flavin reductase